MYIHELKEGNEYRYILRQINRKVKCIKIDNDRVLFDVYKDEFDEFDTYHGKEWFNEIETRNYIKDFGYNDK
jgi:hypothetical protein